MSRATTVTLKGEMERKVMEMEPAYALGMDEGFRLGKLAAEINTFLDLQDAMRAGYINGYEAAETEERLRTIQVVKALVSMYEGSAAGITDQSAIDMITSLLSPMTETFVSGKGRWVRLK